MSTMTRDDRERERLQRAAEPGKAKPAGSPLAVGRTDREIDAVDVANPVEPDAIAQAQSETDAASLGVERTELIPGETDDNPYNESDEALPDDKGERALRRNPSREGGRFDEV
ncbi:MAG: hypothetical protein AB7O39_15820 [Flavobacteriaceae bacterium]